MKRCFLDSNVLSYYKDDTSSHREEAAKILFRLQKEDADLYVSPLILDEVIHTALFVFRQKKVREVFPKLRKLVEEILKIPKLTIINPPTDFTAQKDVIDLMEKYSLHPRDAYHLLTMWKNGIDAFATFDADFTRVFQAKKLKVA